MASERYRLREKQRWLSKRQHSNFGAQKLYDKQAYHDNSIHGMKVDMMLNNMQLESPTSDKRSHSSTEVAIK